MARREFTKDIVIKMLKEISPPTPTDEDHDAVWWNTYFGQKIKIAFTERMEMVMKEIEQMTEY